jgi:general secretion pathway protein E
MIDVKYEKNAGNSKLSFSAKKRLGERLVELKVITPEELAQALDDQKAKNGRIGEILVNQGVIDSDNMLKILSEQLDVPLVDLKSREIQPKAIALITEDIARKSLLIPLEFDEDSLSLAMAYPDDIQAIREISIRTGKKVQTYLAGVKDINNAIDLYYRASKEIELTLSQISSSFQEKEASVEEITTETPIAQSLNLILRQAVRDRASDVHIEPQENRVRVRYRIDGILHNMYSLPSSAHAALVSRIKILSEMNIAEQRRSQDGQFSFTIGSKEIDIRSATMSTANGERVTLRILDKTITPVKLDEIGFRKEQLDLYQNVLKSSFGMILVGGPTGSGKTTTLYSSLNQFDRDTQNIITIEDPIEYKFEDISQTQINNKAGITFATGLRTILRHDPDVVLIGEIRDKDTATIATQAALTGRLVLATIHANDAVSVLFRLVDLGVEPYLISPTLVATVSQRMVRRLCQHCKTPADLLPSEAAAYEKETGEKPVRMFKGKGCNMCANTGYRGRVALIELLVMSETLKRMVNSGASSEEVKKAALLEGMVTMKRDGMFKAREGITTVNEVLRNISSGAKE